MKRRWPKLKLRYRPDASRLIVDRPAMSGFFYGLAMEEALREVCEAQIIGAATESRWAVVDPDDLPLAEPAGDLVGECDIPQ